MGPFEFGILALAGVAAGFVNTLAGGGSMLTLPALLFVGLPAEVANGTNRVGVVAHSIAATLGFRRAGQVDYQAATSLIMPTLLGGLCGAWLAADVIPHAWLEPVLLGTMLIMAIAMMFRPKSLAPTPEEAEPRSLGPASALGLFCAGVYGGFVQAGVGLVLIAVLGGMLRIDLVRSNAIKVLATLGFNVVALGIFAYSGQVDWVAGLILAISSTIGAVVGVRVAVDVDPRMVRGVILAAVLATCVAAAWRRAMGT